MQRKTQKFSQAGSFVVSVSSHISPLMLSTFRRRGAHRKELALTADLHVLMERAHIQCSPIHSRCLSSAPCSALIGGAQCDSACAMQTMTDAGLRRAEVEMDQLPCGLCTIRADVERERFNSSSHLLQICGGLSDGISINI